MLPILFTFRRCPFAIRARLSLAQAQIPVELREVSLKSKPQALVQCSPKATVPVLLLEGGEVIDESLDIMRWAYRASSKGEAQQLSSELVCWNDQTFKIWLDRYKYADRHKAYTLAYSRAQCMTFVDELECRLAETPFLSGAKAGALDYAIFPFVRQFAGVELGWLKTQERGRVSHWLADLCSSVIFNVVMVKQVDWSPESTARVQSAW